jgi:hypothetical protein
VNRICPLQSSVGLCRGSFCLQDPGGDWLGQSDAAHRRPTACPGCTNLADGFPWDFGLALTEEQAQQIPEVKQMVDNHTYTLSAPDPFVAPYFDLLLDRTPKEQPAEPRNF